MERDAASSGKVSVQPRAGPVLTRKGLRGFHSRSQFAAGRVCTIGLVGRPWALLSWEVKLETANWCSRKKRATTAVASGIGRWGRWSKVRRGGQGHGLFVVSVKCHGCCNRSIRHRREPEGSWASVGPWAIAQGTCHQIDPPGPHRPEHSRVENQPGEIAD